TDGVRYAIAEVKNKLGSRAAEPFIQAILYYIRSTESFAKDKPTFRFPCLATLFGRFAVRSAPNMQVISIALPLFYRPTDRKMRAMVARHVGALRKALRYLLACYQSMISNTMSRSPDQHLRFPDSKFPNPMFPYPCSFTCIKTSLTCHFTYCDQMYPIKLLFSVRLTTCIRIDFTSCCIALFCTSHIHTSSFKASSAIEKSPIGRE
ncbi:hypothetical protein EV424DRAFT_1334392, partial [Suillus variegatus]